MSKNVTIKVNRPEGSFIKNWEDAKFVGFSKKINSGLGSCVIELAEEFDYSGNDLNLNNEVMVLITDKDSTGAGKEAKLIYKGYISSYEPWADGKREGIRVNLLGYYTLLGQDIWKNGTTTTFDYSGGATDVGTVFEALMDRYIAETTDPKLIKGQIDTTSTTTQFIFEMLTYREGIDILKSLAPTNWFWYVDQYNQIKFRLKPTTATHSFVFKKHFESIKIVKSMEKIKNTVLLYADNQNLLKLYTNNSSILDYGRRVQKEMIDRGLTTDCDKIAQAFVAENKDPNIRIEVEILDNNESENFGYDIESIDPGDTCSFFGFEEGAADMIEENMLITEVRYFLDKAVVILEPLDAGIIKRSENINNRVDALEREGVNTTYTT